MGNTYIPGFPGLKYGNTGNLKKKFTSNAEWSKIPHTSDEHHTREQAQAVCDLLLSDYGSGEGCPIRGRCECAWVEEIYKDQS